MSKKFTTGISLTVLLLAILIAGCAGGVVAPPPPAAPSTGAQATSAPAATAATAPTTAPSAATTAPSAEVKVAGEGPVGGTLVAGALSGMEFKSLNPNFRRDDGSLRAAALIYCQLVSTDYTHATGTYPDLADSWEISPDASEYTFHLVQNAKWHDGQPLTSADVVWSYNEIKDKKGGAVEYVADIKTIEAPDPYTVKITLNKPDAAFITNQGLFYGPRIMPKHLYEGTDWTTNPNNDKPVGCGPFKFVEWEKGSHLTVEANPDFYRGRPHLDRIIVRFYSLENLISALQAGEVKFSYENFPFSEVENLVKDPKYAVDPTGISLLYWFGFNFSKKPFDDVRVRQAFAAAINPDEISKRASNGWLPPNYGMMPESWALDPTLVYKHDPEKAKQLLDEAGLKPDANGVRLRAKITLAAVMSFPEAIAVIQQELKDVGIELTIESMDFAAYSEKVTKNRDFEIATGGGNAGPDPSNFDPFVKTGGFRDIMGYSNPKVDELLTHARSTGDKEARKKDYVEVQKLLLEDMPRVPFLKDVQAFPYWSQVKNLYFNKSVTGKPSNPDYGFLYTYLEGGQ